MNEKQLACKTNEVSIGAQKIVQLGQFSVGVFQVADDEYRAMLNVCPHKAANLCEGPQCGTTKHTDNGEVAFIYDRRDALIRCAWHGWEFDLNDGTCIGDPSVKAKMFDVSVEGEDIYVHI